MITTKITTTITRKITQTITGAGGVARRWLLNWNGVDQYATHSAWSMSGFGDKIEFSFTADAPGTGDDYLLDSTDGENYLKITNTTAVLTLDFLDTDDSTSRTVAGPTVVAGTTYAGYIEFKADGVDLVVNGTTYDSANVPAIKDDLTHIAAETTPGSYFDGVIHYLRYVNATPLQAVNAVEGNGVHLYGVIPEITLTGDFEIEFWWRRKDRTGVAINNLMGQGGANIGILAGDSGHSTLADKVRVAESLANVTFANALTDIAQDQDVAFRLSRTAGVLALYLDEVLKGSAASTGILTIDQIGLFNGANPLAEDSCLYLPKFTDKSGAEDVVYGPYDLSGDNGDVIENTDPVTGVLGDELITNGGFDTDSDWPHTDTQIAGSALSLADGESAGYTSQDIGLVVGKTYICELVISGRTTGDVDIGLGSYSDGLNQTASGSFIQTVSGSSSISIRFQNSFDGVVESITVKEYPHGTWQNYDSGVDQVALPRLSRNYKMKDGPGATHLADSNGADATGAELFNVDSGDWSRG